MLVCRNAEEVHDQKKVGNPCDRGYVNCDCALLYCFYGVT